LRASQSNVLSSNPVRQSAIRVVSLLMSSQDSIQRNAVMLPRWDMVGKILQAVIIEIQRGDVLSTRNAGMETSEDTGLSNLCMLDVLSCVQSIIKATCRTSNYYIRRLVIDLKLLNILEYFFEKDSYEVTIATGEVFFSLVQELSCNFNDVALSLPYTDHILVYFLIYKIIF
jgi:hypothetical protein